MGQASASEHRFGGRIGAPTSGDATATTPAVEVDIELDSASTAVIFYEYHGADRFDKDNPDPWFFDLGWLLHVGVGVTAFESDGVDLEHTHLSVGVGASMNIGRYLFVDVWPQLMVGEAEIQGLAGGMAAVGLYVRPGAQIDNFFIGLGIRYEAHASEVDAGGFDIEYDVAGVVTTLSAGIQF